MNNFYTYIYLDPRKSGLFEYGSYEFDYEPFYVGKGKDRRYKEIKYGRTRHFKNKINKIKSEGLDPIVIKLKENILEKNSFELEIELIKLIGKKELKEGPLTNETDGGEGISGYNHTEETKELIAEKLRKEYSIIKKEFEKIKYELKTEEKDYENSKQKLEYICDKGHEHSIAWNKFQQERRCPYCATEEQAKKQRKEYTEIKNAFEKIKYNLKTEEKDYENNKQKLEYICDKGHKHSISWSSFQQGHRCPYCYGNKIYFSEIKNTFENIRGCILKTEEKDYENSKQKLEYICPNGHEHSISWNSFQQRKNNYCPKCNRRN